MWIIGCDFHPRFQQIAFVNSETGECGQRRLEHANGEAEQFYRGLQGPVRVGIEAGGYSFWFERLLQELGQELWTGDAAKTRSKRVRRQRNDVRDAEHILGLLLEKEGAGFPRVWRPTMASS
jgi:transposase